MIIKKRNIRDFSVPSSDFVNEYEDNIERKVEKIDPYSRNLSAEDFTIGRLSNRRSIDRRSGFRRDNDQELISKAHEEANAIREKAAQEGFNEGINQAVSIIEELGLVIESLLNAREDAFISASDDLAEMAVQITERILKTEVSCDETLVMQIVRDTIAKVGRDQKSITIKVHPVDLKVVKEAMKTDSRLSESIEIIILEDSTVDSGSCMVETQAGLIDARFSTQLDLLKRMLLTGGKF